MEQRIINSVSLVSMIHFGTCDQFPEYSQIIVLFPSSLYPELQSYSRVERTGYQNDNCTKNGAEYNQFIVTSLDDASWNM